MRANGKLLITGEYFVLDGANSLAVPTRFGQELDVNELDSDDLIWQSFNHKKEVWFSARWKVKQQKIALQLSSDDLISDRLASIFAAAIEQDTKVCSKLKGKHFITKLDFPTQWGLGTSSTLLSLLAAYLNINPYQLLANTFGGSAYDIACAQAAGPIVYQRKAGVPFSKAVHWSPVFKNQIYFVFQGHKQNSREGIRHYKQIKTDKNKSIEAIDQLTMAMLKTSTVKDCCHIIEEHENMIATTLKLPKIKEKRFGDFQGAIKSLGAWGGDFVMAVSDWDQQKIKAYFNTKGCSVVVRFDEMVLD